jgi:hypothetical protein
MKNQIIAQDLELCDLGMSILNKKTKLYKQYEAHRKACFDEINTMNENDGLNNLNDDELLERLFSA